LQTALIALPTNTEVDESKALWDIVGGRGLGEPRECSLLQSV